MTDEELELIRAWWANERVSWSLPGNVQPSYPWVRFMNALLAEVERLRASLTVAERVIERAGEEEPALAHRLSVLESENAAMRAIVEAVGRGDMICAQEDFGTTPICVFGCDGHEDDNEIGAFIHTSTCPVTKALALLATLDGKERRMSASEA